MDPHAAIAMTKCAMIEGNHDTIVIRNDHVPPIAETRATEIQSDRFVKIVEMTRADRKGMIVQNAATGLIVPAD